MILRKIITICKLLKLKSCGVKIKFDIHSNIHISSNVKNNGKLLKIGKVQISQNANITSNEQGKLIIKDNVFINRNNIIVCRDNIEIHENCILGPNVCIYDHDHIFDEKGVKDGYSLSNEKIKKNCWCGAGVIILKGTHIGENSIVGAGTIIKGNYPPSSIIYNKKETIVKKLKDKK